MSHSFFVELGTEELPPKALLTLSQAFCQAFSQGLTDLSVSFTAVTPYATPRRLALWVTGLPASTPVVSVTHWGPPAAVAFDSSGQPTKAGQAFADKQGISAQALEIANDGKIDKVVVHAQAGGDPLETLLPPLVNQALAALPIAKRMRWGSSREEFVRPAQWLVMLFDNRVIPAQVLGLTAGNTTYGHPVHCPQPLVLSDAAQYASVLEQQGYVLVDFAQRRDSVRQQVVAAGAALGGEAVIDEALLDEVTALVEWPQALAGTFEARFLQVPAEALISSMKEHQKYFHVQSAQGALLPYFITVANLQSQDPAQVIAGNEKVIRPRLSDAAFFFATDQQTPLEQQREKLRQVMFQAQLGSLYDKTERLAQLASAMAARLGADTALAARAGALSKADLVSKMVYEFADMQGIAGSYYAVHDGEHPEVAQAMAEQYLPRFAGDRLPQTTTGALLALADRLDTLVGIFGIGQLPSGSKDPFALRRASLGALRILIEKGYALDLRELLQLAAEQYPNLSSDALPLVLNYMLERLAGIYAEAGIRPEVYQAVSAKQLSTPLDINQRVYAVAAFSQLPEAAALAAANKRVANILAKLPEPPAKAVDPAALQEPAEQALARALAAIEQQVAPLMAQNAYDAALTAMAGLREPIDRFFDEVMVMCDDIPLRNNRLALLQQLRQVFLQVADVSCLVVKP
jgi:glycyl-tRNA synthetase beta chain